MEFTNTSSHMVQEVTNNIDGYKMGSMRALAQEPVQNALDAKRAGQGRVTVEYRLLLRQTSAKESCYFLAVTDSGTTGLRGPIVDEAALHARNYKLKPDENWAAFEARGFTKENEDALGSRGQGKNAFLYHSRVPGPMRRMAMLYDTLLETGKYRLGMRFARPVDQILAPPLYDDVAKAAVQSDAFQLEDGLAIPLGLKPLREIGTRVIVPFLSDDVVASAQPGGELCAWLQRCWWRAIQRGKLQIRVVDDQTSDEGTIIEPPAWWQDLPREKGKPSESARWDKLPDGRIVCSWGNIAFGDGHQIRRLVMLHSDTLEEDEILGDGPEYAGIQILRGSQWIETRGVRDKELGDYVPSDKRAGFRGFVEFDPHTDSLLRAAENTQHDGFDARGIKGEVVRSLRVLLKAKAQEFSTVMGWEIPQAVSQQQISQREQQTHSNFLETFLNPNGRKSKSSKPGDAPEGEELLWDCRLTLAYPDSTSARVDWGQSISRVYVEVGVEPSEAMSGSADVVLEWVDSTGATEELYREEEAIRKDWGKDRVQKQFELGNWQILRGKANREGQIECPAPGECKLRAVVEYRGERVKAAMRSVYVQSEPPPPPEKNPITLSISVSNATDSEKKRVDHGEVVQIDFFSRNRLPEDATLNLTASADFENQPYARQISIDLEGTPAGDIADKTNILTVKRQLLDPQQPKPLMLEGVPQVTMPNSSGRYTVRAEFEASAGYQPKPVSKPVYFQRDPSNANSRLPFSIDKVDIQDEIWMLNSTLDRLSYSGKYPLYTEMNDVQKQRRALQGRLAFIAEISANALLEWAMRPKIQDGDDSNFDQLYDERYNSEDGPREKLNRCLENLSKAEESPIEFDQSRRETVAVMLQIFKEEND